MTWAIESHLEDLRLHRGQLYPIISSLREMALAAGPAITEELKYGGILFASSSVFCGIFAYRDHVTLEFARGSTLADPLGILEGRGKFRRHVKLAGPEDIGAKRIKDYLDAARIDIDGTA